MAKQSRIEARKAQALEELVERLVRVEAKLDEVLAQNSRQQAKSTRRRAASGDAD